MEERPSDLVEDGLGSGWEDASVEEQMTVVREKLNADEYMPPQSPPSPSTQSLFNPGIDAYETILDWSENGWVPMDDLTPYQSLPCYLPSDAAIDTLVEMDIVEVGAGNGYWAYVINQNGGDVIPTDLFVEYPDSDSLPATEIDEIGDGQSRIHKTLWTEVIEIDHRFARNFAERDVLLCHPVKDTWLTELLDLLRPSQRLIYVGEWAPGWDGTFEMMERLDSEWNRVDDFPVIDWKEMDAHGHVFSQR